MKHLYLLFALIMALFISACGGGGDSAPAATAPGITLSAAGPAGVAVGVGNTSVPLSWKSVAGATSYNVYYGTAAGVTKANSTKITGALSESPITGLTNGTKYYFVVTSVTANVESALSDEASATPQAASPGITSGITISSGQSQVTLKWSAVTGATSYNIYYGNTAGVTTASVTKVVGDVAGITGAGLTLSGLSNSTKYFFIITAVDAAGNEYPASTEVSATTVAAIPNFMGGAIQKPLTLAGNVTTFAGSVGVPGITDGVGVAALFDTADEITTDGANLYSTTLIYIPVTTNAGNYARSIRKIVIATGEVKTLVVSTTGTSALVSGVTNGGNGISKTPITTDGSFIYAYEASGYGARVIKLNLTTGGQSILANTNLRVGEDISGSIPSVQGLTTDGVNIYGTSSGNSVGAGTVFKVSITTGTVTTLAGNAWYAGNIDGSGSIARFNNPQGITTDGTYLYVADTGNKLIRKIEIATGVVSTVAGGGTLLTYDGTGTAAKFVTPAKITTDGTNLYVTDSGTHTIRKVVIATNVVTTIAGTELTTGSADALGRSALFKSPQGIITDGVSLYVMDTGNSTIRKIQ